MNFDEILRNVGSFGRYQKWCVVLLCVCMALGCMQIYVQVFSAGKSDHWCNSWPEENCQSLWISSKRDCTNLKKSIAIPLKAADNNDTVYEQCVKYNVSDVTFDTAITSFSGATVTDFEVIPCDEGWVFDRETFPSTIIMDFELVCGRSFLPNFCQSAFFAGFLIGSPVAGAIADRFGRRWSLVFFISLLLANGTALSLSINVWMYMALRFAVGLSTRGVTLSTFVLGNELVAISKRAATVNFTFIVGAIGYVILAGLARAIPSWRFVQLAITLPNVPLLIFVICLTSESPLWLVSKNRLKAAEQALTKIANRNQREIPKDLSKHLQELNKHQEGPKGKITEVIRHKIFLKILLINSYNWTVHNFVYYGLSITVAEVGVNPYIAFAISAATEIPAYFSCGVASEKIGRKLTNIISMSTVGAVCCFTTLLPMGITKLAFVTIGKLFSSMAFSLSYTWSAEMLPTYLRTSGLGLFSMVSRIGGITMPMLLVLEEIWVGLPVLVFGILSTVGGLLSFFLPETRNKSLPSTIADVERLYRTSDKDDENREMKEGISNPVESTITEDEK